MSLALTTGACTINRHYHQSPDQPQQQAVAHSGYALDGDSDGYESDDGANLPGADQPIPPGYATPTPRSSYDRGYDDRAIDDGYDSYQRGYTYGYNRGYADCERQCARRPPIQHRHRRHTAPPGHPGPVVPDNPVEWLE